MNGETSASSFLNLSLDNALWQATNSPIFYLVPRSGPRNLRVFGETTNSLSVGWDHADGPVQQYRIIYSPTVGDPIDEYVSVTPTH
jgi:hypothetical protein